MRYDEKEEAYFDGDEGPFCPTCWEKYNKKTLMEEYEGYDHYRPGEFVLMPAHRTCPKCEMLKRK